MSDLVVHNIRLSYDESDERVRNFIKYLKRDEMKEVMKDYYEKVKQNPSNQIYISDKETNEFTLACDHSHNCILGLRGM